MRTSIPRILGNVEKVTESGCWIYMGVLTSTGYGPHRRVYEQLVGPVPPGLELDHKCRVRSCCNPDHLRPLTKKENNQLGSKAQRKHCVNGHEFTPENTRIRPNGTKACRKCLTVRSTEGYYRHRERKIEYQKRYYQAHRDERMAYAAKRRAAKREATS